MFKNSFYLCCHIGLLKHSEKVSQLKNWTRKSKANNLNKNLPLSFAITKISAKHNSPATSLVWSSLLIFQLHLGNKIYHLQSRASSNVSANLHTPYWCTITCHHSLSYTRHEKSLPNIPLFHSFSQAPVIHFSMTVQHYSGVKKWYSQSRDNKAHQLSTSGVLHQDSSKHKKPQLEVWYSKSWLDVCLICVSVPLLFKELDRCQQDMSCKKKIKGEACNFASRNKDKIERLWSD